MNPQCGGVQKVADLLARFFISKGHKVFFLIHERKEEDCYKYPVPIYYLPGINFFSKINIDFYHQLLHELSVDIVINHDASNNRSLLFLNTGNHCVKKISLHHNDPLIRLNKINKNPGKTKLIPGFLLQKYKLYKTKKELKFLLNESHKVVLLSKAFLDCIEKKTSLISNKLLAISNPIILSGDKVIFNKKKQILFVGRIELKQKRLDYLLIIWSRVFEACTDWELIIVGDGPDKNYIELRAEEMHLKKIYFKGYMDPEPYYQDAAIICLTSDYEGFGMVLIEAMQHGVVPIAFNNWASVKDIIVNNETGMLVPTNDVENYITKLIEIIKNEKLRCEIAVNACKHVQQFDINIIGQKWLNLFEEIMMSH